MRVFRGLISAKIVWKRSVPVKQRHPIPPAQYEEDGSSTFARVAGLDKSGKSAPNVAAFGCGRVRYVHVPEHGQSGGEDKKQGDYEPEVSARSIFAFDLHSTTLEDEQLIRCKSVSRT
jgi:hypothetical protein